MIPSLLLIPIFLPLVAAIVCFLIPEKRNRGYGGEILALIINLLGLILAIFFFARGETNYTLLRGPLGLEFSCRSYHFSSFILMAVYLFGVLITLYSWPFMTSFNFRRGYYAGVLSTVGGAAGVVLTNNLIWLLIFWGWVLLMLYVLINTGGVNAYRAANKSLIILGVADFALILGIALVWQLAGTLTMSYIRIPVNSGLATVAFLLMMAGAIAKAGTLPFHTWIPDAAEAAPVPVMAFMPAALDKLLGIYLLGRIVIDFFSLNISMNHVLMVIGAVTIIAAVMMALIQKDLKRLLSYHAVSQVGYMVLGLGTGNPLGLAGGIFHMVNNAIYKSCLFLGGGAVEHRVKTTTLSQLGGLARVMPVSFATFLIAALSISGVPPFNGFVSKWLVYQGVIKSGTSAFPFYLAAALFGSALTLASFIKAIHSVFLGKEIPGATKIKETGIAMLIPMGILASLCVIFGIFAQWPLNSFIGPVVGLKVGQIPFALNLLGIWSPTLATLLLLVGLLLGLIIYRWGRFPRLRTDITYAAGEVLSGEEARVPGTYFYDSVRELGFLKNIYQRAEARLFDFYEWGMAFSRALAYGLYHWIDRVLDRFYYYVVNGIYQVTGGLSKIHSGLLPLYVYWTILGLLIVLLVLIR